jgi:hypothetical protein
MKRIALLALIPAMMLSSPARAASILNLNSIPASVYAGATFDLGVYLNPGVNFNNVTDSEEVSTFSVDLLYSSFLSVNLTSTPTEDGYFDANGVYFFTGTSGASGTSGISALFGISDSLSGGDYDPTFHSHYDELFDIVFTATAAGTPVVEIGPDSFLLDPNGDNLDYTTTSDTGPALIPPVVTPEPGGLLLSGSAFLMLAALRRRRRT